MRHRRIAPLGLVLLFLAAGCSDSLPTDVTAPPEVLLSTSGETTDYEAIILEGGQGMATVIGDNGIIVGEVRDGISEDLAVRWLVSETGITGPEKLGVLPYPLDDAHIQIPNAMNSAGTVVGTAMSNSHIAAWVYSDDIGMQLLPRSVGDTYQSEAFGINDLGIMVGSIDFAVRDSHGTIIDRLKRGAVWPNTDDEPILLPPLEDHHVSGAGSINSEGLVTGYSYAEADYVEYVGVTWRVNGAGEVTEGPHELEAGFRPGRVNNVNNAGDIAGSQEKPGGGTGAAIMRSDERVIALPPLSTKDESTAALGIGEEGPNGVVRIVGGSGSRATLWTIDTTDEVRGPTELPLPSGSFYRAEAGSVNAEGWIAGVSQPRKGGSRPVLWRPVAGGGGDDDGDCKPHPRTGKCR